MKTDGNTLPAIIQAKAIQKLRPDGTSYKSLNHYEEQLIATAAGISFKEVQLAALENDIVPERYARNQKSLSNQEQIRLLQSHVAVIGLGGLGGAVTEILARIGIGTLTLVDGDCFEDSNLNRQLLSSVDDLGKMKAEVAARRVHSINPAVKVRPVADFFTRKNGQELLLDTSLAVDCLDTISDRFILEEASRTNGIPLVSAAIGGTSGQATVIFPDDPGLRLVYGEPQAAPKKGIESALGTLPFAAIAMAAIECAEVVALAIGRPAQLRNTLMIADFADLTMEKLKLG